ncbi:bifunctional oligoribonuclease/PAP phosphatase NrnA [Brevibacillus ruminantium]|uniref:Bifunctional oligoribonuclease/PAP phosphatase NrnA n=1 Tax=Brevibacillus ruminantium TaxID=2950604 RepID=A0ABY4WM79_9BACL|nr:bifunctional oligoribonuclease/PAP phosphatase NrnA [Brevibacillus ruminantium]USG67974.1 bifunctional oligoribonuclease/PAP phosphatase NrnA [Brevibacillus ruminantium]
MSNYKRSLEEAAAFMRAHDRYLVLSHVNPDGDATGSALAVAQMLKDLGKSFVVINEGETPEKFSFLPGSSQILNLSVSPLEEIFSAVIAVDCADRSRMGKVEHLFAPDVQLLNIDHHPTNDGFGTLNVIRTEAAATAEILYDLAATAEFLLQPDLALCLYTGLLTDTGGFRYSNTTPHVMESAARLLTFGVNPGDVAERCLEVITLGHVQVLRRALASLELTHQKLVASVAVSRQDLAEAGANREDAGGLVNYCRNIEGVEVGISFVEADTDVFKVSLRSRSYVNVAEVAQKLGGGGHAKAAGCTVKGPIDTVRKQVLSLVGEAIGSERG